MLYFEDVEIGTVESYGAYLVTREEVLSFASAYDPQPFHLDDEAAAKTFFGKISASGWHTCAMTMRMIVDHGKAHPIAATGSPGIDKVRWRRPVYPGDTLSVKAHVLGKRDFPSRPHLGVVENRYETFNQDGVLVMSFESDTLIERRK